MWAWAVGSPVGMLCRGHLDRPVGTIVETGSGLRESQGQATLWPSTVLKQVKAKRSPRSKLGRRLEL